MMILSHRGFWHRDSEKNRPVAFDRTVEAGFGTETDVRDCLGRLVISHDPPMDDAPPLGMVLDRFEGRGLRLAVNVKADGLAPRLAELMAPCDIGWFAFDMSLPEMIRYARLGLPFFTRHSDHEPEPLLYPLAQGVWLDAFDDEWYDRDVIMRHLDDGKEVCIVSSELHGRSAASQWARLRGWGLEGRDDVMLCTDRPVEARTWFNRDSE